MIKVFIRAIFTILIINAIFLTISNYIKLKTSDCTGVEYRKTIIYEDIEEAKENHSIAAVYKEKNPKGYTHPIYLWRVPYYIQDNWLFYKPLKYEDKFTLDLSFFCTYKIIPGKYFYIPCLFKTRPDSFPISYDIVDVITKEKRSYFLDAFYDYNVHYIPDIPFYKKFQLIEPYCD